MYVMKLQYYKLELLIHVYFKFEILDLGYFGNESHRKELLLQQQQQQQQHDATRRDATEQDDRRRIDIVSCSLVWDKHYTRWDFLILTNGISNYNYNLCSIHRLFISVNNNTTTTTMNTRHKHGSPTRPKQEWRSKSVSKQEGNMSDLQC